MAPDSPVTPTSMTYTDMTARIQEMEEVHDLFEYEVDGWCAWSIIRTNVLVSRVGLLSTQYNYPPWYRIGAMVGQDIWRLTRLSRAQCLVATRSSNHSEKRGKKYEDVFFDEVVLGLDSYFKIEQLNNRDYIFDRNAQLVPRHMTTTMSAVVATLCARLSFGPIYVPKIARIFHRHIVQDLDIATWSEQDITRRLLDFYWRKKLAAYLLRRIKPRFILMVAPSSFPGVVAAAKEQGICVIEYQHGILHPGHISYLWPALAQRYEKRLPLPDEIWLYGSYWRDMLSETTAFWKDKLRVVGSLRMDRYRALTASRDDTICTLVFTTQGYGVEQVVSFLNAFLGLISDGFPIRLYIKLHPIFEYNQSIYEQALGAYPQVQVISGSAEPGTFSLLAQSHFHLSITSTCHFEALALGVPTIIFPFDEHELMLHLCDTGYAFLARTPQELLDIVTQHWGLQVPAEVGDRYFLSGALDNMLRALE